MAEPIRFRAQNTDELVPAQGPGLSMYQCANASVDASSTGNTLELSGSPSEDLFAGDLVMLLDDETQWWKQRHIKNVSGTTITLSGPDLPSVSGGETAYFFRPVFNRLVASGKVLSQPTVIYDAGGNVAQIVRGATWGTNPLDPSERGLTVNARFLHIWDSSHHNTPGADGQLYQGSMNDWGDFHTSVSSIGNNKIDQNTGNASDGTQRVVLADDQPSVTVDQSTHDNLNVNANLQVGDADVSASNSVPATPYDAVGNPLLAVLLSGIAPSFAIPTAGFNYAWSGSSWARLPGDATNGLVVDLGSNNDVSLNAGSNAIGKLAANDGVDIGDVDVTSVSHGKTLAFATGTHSGTTSTQVIAAAGSGTKNKVVAASFTCADASADDVIVSLLDGSEGTTIFQATLRFGDDGMAGLVLPSGLYPYCQTSDNTALHIDLSATSITVYYNVTVVQEA